MSILDGVKDKIVSSITSSVKKEANNRIDDSVYKVGDAIGHATHILKSYESLDRNGGFTNSGNEMLTRRYLTSRDGLVNGFFLAAIDDVPTGLSSYMKSAYSGNALKRINWTDNEIKRIFSSYAADIQLPQDTLRTLQFNGRSGFSQSAPLFSQKGNQITVNFLVDQDMEVTRLIHAWYEYITRMSDGRITQDGSEASNDQSSLLGVEGTALSGTFSSLAPSVGKTINKAIAPVSQLADAVNDILDLGTSQQSSSNIYSCTFYYCSMLPNASDLVFAFVATGVYPTIDPLSDFNGTLGSVDAVKHSITFNADYYDIWIPGKRDTEWLHDQMSTIVENYKLGIFGSSGKCIAGQLLDKATGKLIDNLGNAITDKIKGPFGEVISGSLTSALKGGVNTAGNKIDSRISSSVSGLKMKTANAINKAFGF